MVPSLRLRHLNWCLSVAEGRCLSVVEGRCLSVAEGRCLNVVEGTFRSPTLPFLSRFPGLFYIIYYQMKILIIVDEPDMRETMVHSLLQEQYVVENATDFNSALEKLSIYEYDCILLDIGLPGW